MVEGAVVAQKKGITGVVEADKAGVTEAARTELRRVWGGV